MVSETLLSAASFAADIQERQVNISGFQRSPSLREGLAKGTVIVSFYCKLQWKLSHCRIPQDLRLPNDMRPHEVKRFLTSSLEEPGNASSKCCSTYGTYGSEFERVGTR
jgi:hypothetical protein